MRPRINNILVCYTSKKEDKVIYLTKPPAVKPVAKGAILCTVFGKIVDISQNPYL